METQNSYVDSTQREDVKYLDNTFLMQSRLITIDISPRL